MKKILFTLIISIINFISYAQKAQNVYFFKNGIPTTDKLNADFRRVIQEPDEGSKLYILFEYYLDNTPKTEGFVSSFEPQLIYEGLLKSYNKKGVLISETNYVKNSQVGLKKTYYADGKLMKEVFYEPINRESATKLEVLEKLMFYADSTGNVLVKDGKGYYKSVEKDRSNEGNYLNGLKNGIWKGSIGENTYQEEFKDGKFISGTATLQSGKTSKYDNEGQQPNFKGDIKEFYKYLGRKIVYPKEAQKLKMGGKLYVSFTVEKDGSLVDIKFKNSVGKLLDDEVLEAFEKSPKWNPGIQHGIPVRVKYNINVNLEPNPR
jgi:TonB family protein